MTIEFPVTLDKNNSKVVRDQSGQYILEAADGDVASAVVACMNYVAMLPDPPDEWKLEVN